MKAMRPALRLGAAGALATLVAACSMLLPARAPDVYRLAPPAAHSLAASPTQQDAPCEAAIGTPATPPVLLRIRAAALSSALAGEHIVVMPTPDTVQAYRDARWSDPAPAMVRTALMEALTRDGRFIAVTVDDGTLDVTFDLDMQLRAFQAEYRGGKPVVHVGLDARLVDPVAHRVIAIQSFDAQTAPATADVGAVVQSFAVATDALDARLAGWLACAVLPAGGGAARHEGPMLAPRAPVR
ncbi:ABC-type transport auxiliary lipoprotein family protein [Paraburkholderia oxyphila]|uniref:ABC-type transport auxiliary lipoprotein family protein n=1 Tax=Paraburkholderia oxyphila TaxID=614212 RepID=UPI0005B8AF36|nr:ABC-type transport auxiliary lipoprotein family protein [Paraburkholderia oxyphila]